MPRRNLRPKRAAAKRAPRRAAPPPRARPKTTRKPRPLTASAHFWHPALSSHVWVPKALRFTPCVRIRDTCYITLVADAALDRVVLLQPNSVNGNFQIGCFGKHGLGATVGTSGTRIESSLSTSYGTGRARLHRMGLTVSCLGPTLAGALLPSSSILFGALRVPLRAGDYADYGTIAAQIIARAELRRTTAYALMTCPKKVVACPLDFLEWEQFQQCTASFATDYSVQDSMQTIVVRIDHASTLDNYALTIHAEYDYLPSDDASASSITVSAAVQHPSVAQSLLDGATQAAHAVGGILEDVGSAVTAVRSGFTSVRGALSGLPSAASAIGGPARYAIEVD